MIDKNYKDMYSFFRSFGINLLGEGYPRAKPKGSVIYLHPRPYAQRHTPS